MNAAVASSLSVLRRLVSAAPDAWRDDAVFRYATIGAGIALFTLLAGAIGGAGRHLPSAPPSSTAGVAEVPSPALPDTSILPLPGTAIQAPAPAAIPRIAPSRPLGSVVVSPGTTEADRFGTVTPRR